MTTDTIGFAILAIIAGALVPIQTGYNIELVEAFKSPIVAAVVVFGAGMLGLVFAAAVSGAHIPSRTEMAAAPAIAWIAGGLLAATYVVMLVFAAPRLGAGSLVAFVVLGQMICSITIDQFGLFNFAVHPVTMPRLAGIVLVVAGVGLIKFF